jgi:hypothetical protein
VRELLNYGNCGNAGTAERLSPLRPLSGNGEDAEENKKREPAELQVQFPMFNQEKKARSPKRCS